MGNKRELDFDVEAELARFEAEERARLGIDEGPEQGHWTDEMIDPQFSAASRARTTLLVGGLTIAHDYLVEGALKGLGYNVRAINCPNNEDLRYGKEFGNRGQCNPTYFTVGALVRELCRIRDEEGLTPEEVVDRYIFLTAGACGPCRFGMYVTEYRKALRDAGFDGFRVMLFQQTGGVKQATGDEVGLKLNPEFFYQVAKALFSGDVINLMAYRLRPYEVVPGAVDEAITDVKRLVYEALENRTNVWWALYRGRRRLAQLELDRSLPRPKVAIIGEFWAMTTEGDGCYHLQRFLESEGAEVDIQTIGNLLLYNLWEARHDTEERMMLRGTDGGHFGLEGADPTVKLATFYLAEIVLHVLWQSFAKTLGLSGHKLPNMDEVSDAGHKHYNHELRGGEGHLEVAKLILNVMHQKAHMTLSIKPFGCMPSSGVSDGVQSIITELYPEAIFCAVETSGDGAVNFYSRVQMFLFKAKQRAKEEHQATLAQYGLTQEEVSAFVRESGYKSPFFKAPHLAAGTGADLIHHVAPLIGKGPLGRARVHASRIFSGVKGFVSKDLPKGWAHAKRIAPYLPAIARVVGGEAEEGLRELYERTLSSLVRPSEEEQEAIAKAEKLSEMRPPAEAVAGAAAKKNGQSLPIMA